jgi:RNase adapter protein RapZ
MSQAGSPLLVRLTSFGYRYSGIPQDDAGHGGGFVFDCRCLPNPHWDEALRPYGGGDPPIRAYMQAHPEVAAFVAHAAALVLQAARQYRVSGRTHLLVSCGCTGGRHRSVYVAERLAEVLRGAGIAVRVEHADLHRPADAEAAADAERDDP